MLRLQKPANLEIINTILSAYAKRSHCEYLKFQKYYQKPDEKENSDIIDPELRPQSEPVPRRNRDEFFDKTHPSKSYPYEHSLNCAPESFFDYHLSRKFEPMRQKIVLEV